MTKLGDVVFCVDCDRVRLSPAPELAAASGADSSNVEPPRRMATKKDANGEPLCPSCLDSRQARRRAEFMLHDDRAPITAAPPSPARAGSTPRKKVDFVRMLRQRPQPAEVVPAPPEKDAAQASIPAARDRAANLRAAERRFARLIVEVGFLRAQELIDELKTAARRARR
jgi:hypothetical protein